MMGLLNPKSLEIGQFVLRYDDLTHATAEVRGLFFWPSEDCWWLEELYTPHKAKKKWRNLKRPSLPPRMNTPMAYCRYKHEA